MFWRGYYEREKVMVMGIKDGEGVLGLASDVEEKESKRVCFFLLVVRGKEEGRSGRKGWKEEEGLVK